MTNIAFVFPGQGSQSVGMLAELADIYPVVIDSFTQASSRLGYDLWHLVQNGPENILNQTEHTQAAMLTADVAIYRLLQKLNPVNAQVMAGHSLGEYAALVCADALTLEDAAALVARRGQLMQETVPMGQGAMAAIIGLTDAQVIALCEQASTSSELVTPANFNAIGQVVIAGHTSAVEQAVALADNHGARMAKIIPVSVPCHCSLLNDAASAFEPYLANTNFKSPKIAVISNVDLSIYNSPEDIRILLKQQLYKPVRWVETIQFLTSQHISLVIESGPGKVLSGLIKRIDKGLPALCIQDSASLEQVLSQLITLEKCCD